MLAAQVVAVADIAARQEQVLLVLEHQARREMAALEEMFALDQALEMRAVAVAVVLVIYPPFQAAAGVA